MPGEVPSPGVFCLLDFCAAPFDGGEAGALRRGERLRGDLDGFCQRLPCHEDAQQCVGLRRDGELCRVGVGIRLERDEVIGVLFHLREPIDDELVGLRAGQAELRERMIAQNMTINLDDAAKRLVAKEGTDTAFGARPLRRAIQRMLEDPLSEQILEGRWTSGSVVDVTVSEDGEELVFSEGTGSIPAPRKRDSIARDAELLLTNYDLGHAGVGSGRGAGTPAGSLAGGE